MTETQGSRGVWGVLMLVMFLFGGTVGYIARDVRADEQIKEAAEQARQDVQQATLETLQRVERAGTALVRGVAATAESTGAAAAQQSPAKADPDVRTEARDTSRKRPARP